MANFTVPVGPTISETALKVPTVSRDISGAIATSGVAQALDVAAPLVENAVKGKAFAELTGPERAGEFVQEDTVFSDELPQSAEEALDSQLNLSQIQAMRNQGSITATQAGILARKTAKEVANSNPVYASDIRKRVASFFSSSTGLDSPFDLSLGEKAYVAETKALRKTLFDSGIDPNTFETDAEMRSAAIEVAASQTNLDRSIKQFRLESEKLSAGEARSKHGVNKAVGGAVAGGLKALDIAMSQIVSAPAVDTAGNPVSSTDDVERKIVALESLFEDQRGVLTQINASAGSPLTAKELETHLLPIRSLVDLNKKLVDGTLQKDAVASKKVIVEGLADIALIEMQGGPKQAAARQLVINTMSSIPEGVFGTEAAAPYLGGYMKFMFNSLELAQNTLSRANFVPTSSPEVTAMFDATGNILKLSDEDNPSGIPVDQLQFSTVRALGRSIERGAAGMDVPQWNAAMTKLGSEEWLNYIREGTIDKDTQEVIKRAVQSEYEGLVMGGLNERIVDANSKLQFRTETGRLFRVSDVVSVNRTDDGKLFFQEDSEKLADIPPFQRRAVGEFVMGLNGTYSSRLNNMLGILNAMGTSTDVDPIDQLSLQIDRFLGHEVGVSNDSFGDPLNLFSLDR